LIFAASEVTKLKRGFLLNYISVIGVWGFLNILVFAVLKPGNESSILSVAQTAVIFALISFSVEGGWRQRLKAIGAICLATVLTEISIIIMIKAVYDVNLNELDTESTLATVISVLSLEIYYASIMLVLLLFRIRDDSFRRMRPVCIISAFIAIVFGAIFIAYNTSGADKMNEQDVFINQMTHCLITVILIVLYYAMKSSISKAQDEERIVGIESYMQQTRRFYELAEQKFSEAARIRHDVRNQVQTIEYLMAENEIDPCYGKEVICNG
jgi:hypothetical protein